MYFFFFSHSLTFVNAVFFFLPSVKARSRLQQKWGLNPSGYKESLLLLKPSCLSRENPPQAELKLVPLKMSQGLSASTFWGCSGEPRGIRICRKLPVLTVGSHLGRKGDFQSNELPSC